MERKTGTLSMVVMDGKRVQVDHNQVLRVALGLVVIVVAAATVYMLAFALSPAASGSTAAGLEADSARWSAMGTYYARESALLKRGAEADAARWSALGGAFERSSEANASRWSALGATFQQGVTADSARWSALGEHYQQRYEAAADASTARYKALAEVYGFK